MINRPIRFAPYYKSVIWGGNKLAKYKNIDDNLDGIGESWEISAVPGHESVVVDDDLLAGRSIVDLINDYGEKLLGSDVVAKTGLEFPLLIKLIDADQNLSVQVHPDDKLAKARHNSRGKTEMWYIIDSAPEAKIYSGLSRRLTPDDYVRRISDNTIMDVVGEHNSAPEQFYYIPAGTVHAIGAGNLLAEVQQSSDITYRVYDYDRRDADGNPRELHVELAKDAIDYRFPHQIVPTAKTFSETTRNVISNDYFNIDYLNIKDDTQNVNTSGRTFAILMVTDGHIDLTTNNGSVYTYNRGVTVLIPAALDAFKLSGLGKGLLVTCS